MQSLGLQAAAQLELLEAVLPLLTSHSMTLWKRASSVAVQLACDAAASQSVMDVALGPAAVPAIRVYFLKRIRSMVASDVDLLFKLNWRQLARHHQALALELMEKALGSAGDDNAALKRRWALVEPAMKPLLGKENQANTLPRLLDFLERFTALGATLPEPLKAHGCHLVPNRRSPLPTADADQLLTRLVGLVTRPGARTQLLADCGQLYGWLRSRRVMLRLGEVHLTKLLDAFATSGARMQAVVLAMSLVEMRGRLFLHAQQVSLEPAWLNPRSEAYSTWGAMYTLRPLLEALPPRMRDAEAKRLAACKFARDEPKYAEELLSYRYLPDVNGDLRKACQGATPQSRVGSLQAMLKAASLTHKSPQDVLQVLCFVARRIQSEQSPVVQPVLDELADLQASLFTDEHAGVLRKIADDTLCSPDLCSSSVSSLGKLAFQLLIRRLAYHPADWTADAHTGGKVVVTGRLLKLSLDLINRLVADAPLGRASACDLLLTMTNDAKNLPENQFDQVAGQRVRAQQLLTWWLTEDLPKLPYPAVQMLVFAFAFALHGRTQGYPPFQALVDKALWTPVKDEGDWDFSWQCRFWSTATIARMWMGDPATRDDRAIELLQPLEKLDERGRGEFRLAIVACLVVRNSHVRGALQSAPAMLDYISRVRTDLLDQHMGSLEATWIKEAQVPEIKGSTARWLARQQHRYAALLKRVLTDKDPDASAPPAGSCTPGDEQPPEVRLRFGITDRASVLRPLAQLSITTADEIAAAVEGSAPRDRMQLQGAALFGLPRLDNQAGVLPLLLKWAEEDAAKTEGQPPAGRQRGPVLGSALLRCAGFVHSGRELVPALHRLLGREIVRVTLHKQVVRMLCMFPSAEGRAMLDAQLAGWEGLHRDVKIALMQSLQRYCSDEPSGLVWAAAERCAKPSVDKDIAQALINCRPSAPSVTPEQAGRQLALVLRLKAHPHRDVRWALWQDLLHRIPSFERGAQMVVIESAAQVVTDVSQVEVPATAKEHMGSATAGEGVQPDMAAGRDLPARQRLTQLCSQVAAYARLVGSTEPQRDAARDLAAWLAGDHAAAELRFQLWDQYVALVVGSINWPQLQAGQAAQRILQLCIEAPSAEEVALVAQTTTSCLKQYIWAGASQQTLLAFIDQLKAGSPRGQRVALAVLIQAGDTGQWEDEPLRMRLADCRRSRDRTIARLALQVCVHDE
ncbi:hypothetical protein WJX72_006283 [[Myrmecia] bisecta]|uniref:Uncharacterized protein n=1 Tax=[Myrmecia] bisecta TaxID=41462 RepID=A0AAW1R795_9CHLO